MVNLISLITFLFPPQIVRTSPSSARRSPSSLGIFTVTFFSAPECSCMNRTDDVYLLKDQAWVLLSAPGLRCWSQTSSCKWATEQSHLRLYWVVVLQLLSALHDLHQLIDIVRFSWKKYQWWFCRLWENRLNWMLLKTCLCCFVMRSFWCLKISITLPC